MTNVLVTENTKRMNETFMWICATCWHTVWGANPPLTARCGMRRMRHDPSPHYCHCNCENQPWLWRNE